MQPAVEQSNTLVRERPREGVRHLWREISRLLEGVREFDTSWGVREFHTGREFDSSGGSEGI